VGTTTAIVVAAIVVVGLVTWRIVRHRRQHAEATG